MSVAVYIDGRPVERFEAYREILRRIDTSQRVPSRRIALRNDPSGSHLTALSRSE